MCIEKKKKKQKTKNKTKKIKNPKNIKTKSILQKTYLHQPNRHLEHIVLQRKVGEAIPEAARARLGPLTRLEQVPARVVNLELRHS